MKYAITQLFVEKLLRSLKRSEVWDTKLQNFYLQVRASGSGTYYVRYVRPGSNEKATYRLGDAVALTAAAARILAQSTLSQVAMGFDPADDKKRLKACPDLQTVVDKNYLPHARLTKKSWLTDESMLRCHVLPILGKRTLSAITTSDIESLMHSMRNGGKSGPAKGRAKTRPLAEGVGYAPATCNRVAILLSYIFNLSIEKWKLPGVSKNPAVAVKPFAVNNTRHVFLSPEEVGALLKAGGPKPGQHNPMTLSIVMFLVLTGVRRANALKARWCELDEARGLWNIPVTKNGKPQSIHLSPELKVLLNTLPSRGESEYIFPNPNTGLPFVSVYSSWNSMRIEAGMPQLRMHDLRHTFASLLINGGASLYSVQGALGHSNPQTTQRYAHLSELTQRTAVQSVAASLRNFLPIRQAEALCTD